MREVNFSIPNANKASVGITTALYDRRALDCTSTLPLINSLNNLAYLTTSSGRIRDILTVDGGIERLVCILKEGRSKDMMEMWKWNLAFQCVVNIGVRGSEAVRTRVVEADMVPVVATILDNYFQVVEKYRERADADSRRKGPFASAKSLPRPLSRTESYDSRNSRSRRQVPPPITIPDARDTTEADDSAGEVTPTTSTANMSLSSPPERTTFTPQHHHHHHQRSLAGRAQLSTPNFAPTRLRGESPGSPLALQSSPATAAFGIRPVRDIDRLPSMVPTLHAELSSQPQSPTTPIAPPQQGSSTAVASGSRPRRRPSIRHQLSMSGSDDDAQIEETPSEGSNGNIQPEPVVGIQNGNEMPDIVGEAALLASPGDAVALAVPDDETFAIRHRSADGSLVVDPAATPAQAQVGFVQAPLPAPVNPLNATPPNMQQAPAWYAPRGSPDRSTPGAWAAAMPREEDVLMSLQLLAYVSKYCYLRSYFQQSHLVPRLKLGNDVHLFDPDCEVADHPVATQQELDEQWDNEFVQKPGQEAYNIFPLIEKFTARAASSRHAPNSSAPQQGDMQYWAGVVMRNLCRKDESRGGIRQCAYWRCGKWEEYTRQFAKCRRCRRTKYCSKECQKGAWGSHRFWCVAADAGEGDSGNAANGERSSHHRHHHRSSHHSHHHSSQH